MSNAGLRGDMAWLYRFYDADGALLYLGVTTNLPARLRHHRSVQPWWPRVVAVEWEPTNHSNGWHIKQDEIRNGRGGEFNVTQLETIRRGWVTRKAKQDAAHGDGRPCQVGNCLHCRESVAS